MCFGMIGSSAEVIASSSAGCGSARRITAVCASGSVTALTGANMVLNGWLSRTVSTENCTSADVTGRPSWNFASLRRNSVTLRASSDRIQRSARNGCGCHFASNFSGVANSCAPGYIVATPDCTAGFRCRGRCVVPSTSTPPFAACAATSSGTPKIDIIEPAAPAFSRERRDTSAIAGSVIGIGIVQGSFGKSRAIAAMMREVSGPI